MNLTTEVCSDSMNQVVGWVLKDPHGEHSVPLHLEQRNEFKGNYPLHFHPFSTHERVYTIMLRCLVMGCYLRFRLTNFVGQVPMALNISRGLGIAMDMVNMQIMLNSTVIQRLLTFFQWRMSQR